MESILRLIKIGMMASIALFFSVIAFNNIVDPHSGFPPVQEVLSMETTWRSPAVMGRAITNPLIQKAAYNAIIFCQLVTALLCWIGCLMLLRNLKATPGHFHASKAIAFIGLFLGFMLYMVGFIIVGSEWFCMWQSPNNAQTTSGLFISFIMFTMIFLQLSE
jgi:predicted small integral membrane protein